MFYIINFFFTHLTPLHLAVLSRNSEAVRLLLSQPNININCQSPPSYHTPLHLAARESEEDIMKILLADKRIRITVGNLVFYIYFSYNLSFKFSFLINSFAFCRRKRQHKDCSDAA